MYINHFLKSDHTNLKLGIHDVVMFRFLKMIISFFYMCPSFLLSSCTAIGGDITETAIELAPLDYDNSHSRKRVIFCWCFVLLLLYFSCRIKRTLFIG